MRTSYTFIFATAILFIQACGPSQKIETNLPERVDFAVHVRPILSDRCFSCHGPDEASREADLRLDTEEGALATLDSLGKRFAIVKGKPRKSELIKRIDSDDADEIMPPPDSKLILTDREKAILNQWIKDGAEYTQHWAFVAPQKSQLPEVDTEHPIDRFIDKRLAAKGLLRNQEANKETLLRRVSFDLTGLPPSIAEMDAFLADTSQYAYEKVVDRLLDSPNYGEHMAVDWMDVSRYADSHGYQSDWYRPHWPWRDWVIEAFNDNMPYDQFVTWQLGGDILENATNDQILATGFNRNHAQNGEGGIVPEEFRVEYVADRTQTFGTAFLGLTLQCARCHDHKFDPISQQEFYELFSFFNNVDEAGQITFFFDDLPGPTLHLPDEEAKKQIAFLEKQIQNKKDEINGFAEEQKTAFEEWKKAENWKRIPFPRGRTGHFTLDKVKNDLVPNRLDNEKPGKIIDPISMRITENAPAPIEGVKGKGLLLNGDDALRFEGIGKFSRGESFTIGMWVNIPKDLKEGVIFHSNRGAAIYTYKGYQVSIKGDHFDMHLAHDFPHNAIHFTSQKTIPRDQWIHLALSYDGSSKAKGVHFYINGENWDLNLHQDKLKKDIIWHTYEDKGAIETELKIGARWRSRGVKGTKVDEIMVYDRELSALEMWRWVGNNMEDFHPTEEQLWNHYLKTEEAYRFLQKELDQRRFEWAKTIDKVPEVMVMDEREKIRPSYVLARGSYDAPQEAVYGHTPRDVLPFPKNYEKNRKGLAQWLFHPDNPLLARVTVNRFWQRYFGHGLTKTTEDLGYQGELPSHPDLLDWLALEFMESGWDVKALQKLIVMSGTYRQNSVEHPEKEEHDPGNVWLSRGPSSRLSAEMLRDQSLFASGLMTQKIGGPSAWPYQPDGLWAFNRMPGGYKLSKGEDLYRRSLYTIWRRTIPPPNMNTFDAPSRAYCVVRRQKTTTPLQSLVLMNDPTFLEASRVLAERMIKEGGNSIEEKIQFGFRLLTSRYPKQKELELLTSQYTRTFEDFSRSKEKAKEFLAVGEYVRDKDLAAAEVATCSVIATTIMNFDATVRKR